MEADMIRNLDGRHLLDLIDHAILITDCEAKLVFSNKAYQKTADQMKDKNATLTETILEAALKGTACKTAENFLVTASMIVGSDAKLIMTQISDVAHIVSLKKQLEDSNNYNKEYRAKLSRLNLQDCIANSANMICVFEKAKQVANFPTTVLLNGETGVGKEVVATYIHRNSTRANKPFIKINCSAIPEQLMESELFGYMGGAFTGAQSKGKAGLFELADQGTLLLDEIGDMNVLLQAKLLRALQENEIMRLGGQKTIKVDVRVISSTNRDLKAMMEVGQFLDALYYRLNVVELKIPPLRERKDDIMPLAVFYLTHFCEKYKLEKTFSPELQECFMHYVWPGNIRELRNIVENLVVSSRGRIIGMDELPQKMIAASVGHEKDVNILPDVSMKEAVERLQRQLVQRAIKTHGSLRKAASALDMDAATLHRLIKKLEIKTV